MLHLVIMAYVAIVIAVVTAIAIVVTTTNSVVTPNVTCNSNVRHSMDSMDRDGDAFFHLNSKDTDHHQYLNLKKGASMKVLFVLILAVTANCSTTKTLGGDTTVYTNGVQTVVTNSNGTVSTNVVNTNSNGTVSTNIVVSNNIVTNIITNNGDIITNSADSTINDKGFNNNPLFDNVVLPIEVANITNNSKPLENGVFYVVDAFCASTIFGNTFLIENVLIYRNGDNVTIYQQFGSEFTTEYNNGVFHHTRIGYFVIIKAVKL